MRPYPKPSDIGGTVIRKVIALLKENSIQLPLKKPVLIATSGGVDSMSLAHLLAKYGRRIVDPKLITFLHFDHQWRKESGTVEKKSVQKFAKGLGVKFVSVKLKSQRQKLLSKNLEEDARLKRNAYYSEQAGPQKNHGFVLTAHHADDVVETLVWRFFRGELLDQNEGILFQDNAVLRPFLKVFKEEIHSYAQAENVPYHDDPMNHAPGQMRAFFRTKFQPILLKQFPGYRTAILRYTAVQKKDRGKA